MPDNPIEVMRTLPQQAAAWLLGLTTRTLRDHPDVPRNTDGSYCGQEIVAWHRQQITPPQLSEDLYERLLLVQEAALDRPLGPEILAVMETVTELERRHGDAGLVALGRVFLDVWREQE